MSPELEQELYARYPAMFAERHLPQSESSMCWGLQCEAGWFGLIAELCQTLEDLHRHDDMPPVVFRQVKQKLGCLVLEYSGGDSRAKALVNFARAYSARLCECCAKPAVPPQTPPPARMRDRFQHMRSLCADCRVQAEER